VGSHGTSRDKAEKILRTRRFTPSRNKGDWLGHGVYFWEHAPRQAPRWAEQRYGKDNAIVVASLIRLGNCLDLVDPENALALHRYDLGLREDALARGEELPGNHNAQKNLDCYVPQAFYAHIEALKEPRIDSSRGVYVPTEGKAASDSDAPESSSPVRGRRLWTRSW